MVFSLATWRKICLVLLPVLLIGGFLLVRSTSSTAHNASAQSVLASRAASSPITSATHANCFQATATSANMIPDPTFSNAFGVVGSMFPISDPYGVLNNNPSAVVIATFSGFGGFGGVFFIGVRYISGQWYIDGEMSAGNVFNVCDARSTMSNPACICFTQVATTANTHGDQTLISPQVVANSLVQGDLAHQYYLEVTPDYTSGVIDTAPLAVGLNTTLGRFSIYHADGSPIPQNATYSVVAQAITSGIQGGKGKLNGPSIQQNQNEFIHTVTAPTIPQADTFTESAITSTSALLFVTDFVTTCSKCVAPTFDPLDIMDWYNFDSGQWGVMSADDTSGIPIGSSFSVFLIPAV